MQTDTSWRGTVRGWLAILAAVALMGIGVGTANPASAASCPTVGSDGTVTPMPSAGVEWSYCDLSGADLSGADLSGANLYEADLSGANLNNADLSDAILDNADLSDAKLRDANLAGARYYSAGTYGANGADFTGANLTDAAVQSVSFLGANLSTADFSRADMQYSWLSGADLSGAVLSGANLGYVTFSGLRGGESASGYPAANLTGAILDGAYGCPTFGAPIGLPDSYLIVDGCLPDTTPPVVTCEVPAPGPQFDKGTAGSRSEGHIERSLDPGRAADCCGGSGFGRYQRGGLVHCCADRDGRSWQPGQR